MTEVHFTLVSVAKMELFVSYGRRTMYLAFSVWHCVTCE